MAPGRQMGISVSLRLDIYCYHRAEANLENVRNGRVAEESRLVEESRSEDHPTHTITVAHRAIVELKLNPQNPRTHSTRQLRQIGESIKAFGFNVPVLIDAQLQVIAGHGRIAACQRLGWQSVPTICLEHLSEAQARAFMIADGVTPFQWTVLGCGIKSAADDSFRS
jgi:ParB-like nuclease domain